MLPFSAGVWQHGFESQSRYIALRIRAGENTPVIRGAVWRLFHLSKSQEKSNPERRCRDIGFSFRRVRQVWKNAVAQEKCSAALSTEIASIGLCQPQSRPHKTSGHNLPRERLRSAAVRAGQMSTGCLALLNTPKKEK